MGEFVEDAVAISAPCGQGDVMEGGNVKNPRDFGRGRQN